MPDAEAKLKVTIETAATGNAPEQTAAGVEKVASAAQKAAPAMGKVGTESKNTAQELGRGVEIGNAAVATLTNIASSGQGGAAGLIAITRAGFSAGTMFKGLLASLGPFGIAAAAVGIAVGLISAALRKSEASAKAAEERLAALNKVKLDEAAREQDKLRTAAEATLRVLEAEARAKEEIADAELAKRKAIVRADARDSGEAADVTERKLLALDRQRDDEKRAAALDLLREKTSRLAAEEARQAQVAKEAADAAADSQRRLDTLNARERAAQAIPETTSAMGLPAANPAYARAQEELAAARAAADGISAETVKQQQAAAEALAKAAAEAKRTADEARTTLDIESRKKGAIDPIIQATRAAENRAATPQSEAEKAKTEEARKKAEAAADERTRLVSAAQLAQRIRNNMDVDVESARRVYPLFKFPDRPGAPTGGPLTPTTIGAPQPTAAPAAAPAGSPFSNQSFSERNGQSWMNTKDGAFPVSRSSDQGAITDALKGTAKATESAPTGEEEAKAAQELQAKTEAHAQAAQQASATTVQALTQCVGISEQLVGVQQQTTATVQSHSSRLAALEGAVRSLRAKSARA